MNEKRWRARAVWSGVTSLALVALAGCGASAPAVKRGADGSEGGDQVAVGGRLYAAECASCHGDSGEGDGAPALVGAAALPLDPPAGAKRKLEFHTGADVFGFVKATMPPGQPGQLSDAEYAAILAFTLKANGVDLTGKHVDASTAASFVLHP